MVPECAQRKLEVIRERDDLFRLYVTRSRLVECAIKHSGRLRLRHEGKTKNRNEIATTRFGGERERGVVRSGYGSRFV